MEERVASAVFVIDVEGLTAAGEAHGREVKLAILRLLSYYRHRGGHASWGYSFFKSGAATPHNTEAQALLRPTTRRRTTHTFDDDGFDSLLRDLDLFAQAAPRGVPRAANGGASGYEGGSEPLGVLEKSAVAQSEQSEAGVLETPAPARREDAARKVAQALREVIGGYDWKLAPEAAGTGKKGRVLNGGKARARGHNAVVLLAECPGDEDMGGQGGLISEQVLALMRRGETGAQATKALGGGPLQEAFRNRQMVLHWVDTQ
ncbi:hypothetical protein T484DRAFT_1937558, partial [Baffinella frigidus]